MSGINQEAIYVKKTNFNAYVRREEIFNTKSSVYNI